MAPLCDLGATLACNQVRFDAAHAPSFPRCARHKGFMIYMNQAAFIVGIKLSNPVSAAVWQVGWEAKGKGQGVWQRCHSHSSFPFGSLLSQL